MPKTKMAGSFVLQIFRLQRWFAYCKLCFRSLFYSANPGEDWFLEFMFQPVFYLGDLVVPWAGPVFVGLVCCLLLSVVLIMYLCVLPTVLPTLSTLARCIHLLLAHWLLVHVVFHFKQAVCVPPGTPSWDIVDRSKVSTCKKCFSPRPPRTHHCSVCNRCILKMDHHCYWMNNCVGHFNHRYFYSFCTFTSLGCIYCCVTSTPLAMEAYAVQKSTTEQGHRNGLLLYMWVLCSGVSVLLTALTLWHTRLLTRGVTSVERLQNQQNQEELRNKDKFFRNIYDHGALENWKRFLGVRCNRDWLCRVALPSAHLPPNDGYEWSSGS
uniref:palmitoyltransferase ZDHHC16-like isoform X1 n=2 Tax=Myxine glutinosa TaxID=7769 RepID=UPI00358EF877